MLIDSIVQNPRELGYNEQEDMADSIIEMISRMPNMTYERAYKVIKSHYELYKEALSHLNHNAAMELRDNPVVYSLK